MDSLKHARHARLCETSAENVLHEPRALAVVFAIITVAVMLIPFVGMLWAPSNQPVGNEELSEAPALVTEEGQANVDYLSDLGNYFETHFAYRPQIVDATSLVYAKVFNHSVTSQVILGSNDWLYYGETLSDYLAEDQLSDRTLYCVAHNLAMLQAYCQQQGSSFVFTLAPNKNALYGTNMPSYYLQGENTSIQRLNAYLDKLGVNYVDMFSLFENQSDVLYFKHDTHWNAQGAALAVEALEDSVDHETTAYDQYSFVAGEARTGDLTSMIFPESDDAVDQELNDANPVVTGVNDGEEWTGGDWVFMDGSSVEENDIVTAPVNALAQDASGSLLMFRDSFANNMIGYLTCDYEQASFSKLIPYNALRVAEEKPSVVIVERAQRHLSYLAEAAFAMPSPQVSGISGEMDLIDGTTCVTGKNGPLESFAGELAGSWSDEARVFVRVTMADGTKQTYEAFLLCSDDSDYCYQAYVYANQLGSAASVDVMVYDQGALATVYSGSPDLA